MSSHGEFFQRLLDQSSALLATPGGSGTAIPDDDLHREIIVPLLPTMLGDKAIREHWIEQAATGFPARLARHFDEGEPAPHWLPEDFEIHVAASYHAGADARALADTLLSEESLRDMTATLMNQLLDVLWLSLAPALAEIAEPIIPPAPELGSESVPAPVVEIAEEVLPPVNEPEPTVEIQPVQWQPSRALIRALCRKLAPSVVQRSLIATRARGAGAAVIARRFLRRAAISPRRLPRRVSL